MLCMELALIENIQRQDLNAIEEAQAYRSLVEQFSISQEDVAKRVGKNRTTVTNALRLLKLPDDIQRDIVEERLSMGHARALLALESAELIEKARHEILHRQFSVRATEDLVRRLKVNPHPAAGKASAAAGPADDRLWRNSCRSVFSHGWPSARSGPKVAGWRSISAILMN